MATHHDCGRVIEEHPSLFPEAPPVRVYEDGCQEYGPYVLDSNAP